MESPARQSPSPQRELPTTTTFEAQNNQVQEVRQQNAEQGTVHSPVDNSVSSMSDATRVEDSPTEQQFAGMLRFDWSFLFLIATTLAFQNGQVAQKFSDPNARRLPW